MGLQLPPHRASPLQLFSFTLGLFNPRQEGEGSGGRWAPSPDTLARGCGSLTAAVDRYGFHVAPASAFWECAELVTEEQA